MIKIDVDTRIWEIPEEEKFIGVESDGSVKKYKFELSKNEFYEGLNFTDCNCYINYKNEDNDAIPYGITDMAVQDDGKVTFTWEVSRGATIFQGNTFAVLCVKKVREDGTITNEWNSRIGAFIVNKGIEPKDSIAELPEIDIISQLLNTAQYVNQIAQENISKSEENIAKSEELIQTAQELLEQNDFYKGYIVDGEEYSGKASNSGIKLYKVVGKTMQDGEPSYGAEVPIQYTKITKINAGTFQLFDASKIPTTSAGGATVTNNGDGSFTISGSGALTGLFGRATYLGYNPLKAKRLIVRMNGSDGNDPLPSFQVIGCSVVGNSSVANRTFTITNNGYFDITEDILNKTKDIYFIFYGAKGDQIKPNVVKPMVYQDGDGTWEPYKHGTVETSLTLAEGDVYENSVITRKMKEVNVTRNFAFSLQGTYENTLRFDSQYLTDKKSTSRKGYCNLLPKGSDIDNGDYEHFRFSSANKGFVIYINKSRLETPDVSGLAKYLDTAGMKLLYELDVPTTEELKVPTVPSYYPNTNIWTDNTLPTDMQWKILADSDRSLEVEANEKRIAALEKQLIGG